MNRKVSQILQLISHEKLDCKTKGIGLVSAKSHYLEPKNQGEFIFGYGQLEESEIDRGIFIFTQVLTKVRIDISCKAGSRTTPTF